MKTATLLGSAEKRLLRRRVARTAVLVNVTSGHHGNVCYALELLFPPCHQTLTWLHEFECGNYLAPPLPLRFKKKRPFKVSQWGNIGTKVYRVMFDKVPENYFLSISFLQLVNAVNCKLSCLTMRWTQMPDSGSSFTEFLSVLRKQVSGAGRTFLYWNRPRDSSREARTSQREFNEIL